MCIVNVISVSRHTEESCVSVWSGKFSLSRTLSRRSRSSSHSSSQSHTVGRENTVTDREPHDQTYPQTHRAHNPSEPQRTGRTGHARPGANPRRLRRGRPQRTQPCPLPLPEHLPAYSPRLLEGGRVPNTGVPVWYRYSIGTPHRLAKNDKNRSVGRGVVVVVSLAPPLLARHGLRAPCPMLYCSRCRLGSQLPCTN